MSSCLGRMESWLMWNLKSFSLWLRQPEVWYIILKRIFSNPWVFLQKTFPRFFLSVTSAKLIFYIYLPFVFLFATDIGSSLFGFSPDTIQLFQVTYLNILRYRDIFYLWKKFSLSTLIFLNVSPVISPILLT